MTRSRRLILPLGLFFAGVALAAIVLMVRASADDLLHQSARLLAEAFDGHAVLHFEFETPEKADSGTVEVWGHKEAGPNGEPAFRIVEILDVNAEGEERFGSAAVSDGTQAWLWRKQKNTVYVGTLEELKARMKEGHGAELTGHDLPEYDEAEMPQTPEEAVDKLLEYFKAERAGTAEIGLTDAYQLRLVPIPEKMPDEFRANGGLLDIWLRTSDSAPLGIEFSGAAVGSGKITASVLELDQLDQEEADELFSFAIPKGAEVVPLADLEPPSLSLEEAASAASFDILLPSYLPSAARLEGINEVRGAIVQRYRLPDGDTFTVAQGVDDAAQAPDNTEGEQVIVRGVTGTLYQDESGTRSLLTWNEGPLKIWVGGDLKAETALEIANSLN
jgi:hypothetical protein